MKKINTTAICNALTNADVKTDVERQFNKLLADRLHGDEIYPGGIAVVCACFLSYLRKGTDGFTGQPLHATLRGLPPIGIFVMFVAVKHTILNSVPEDVRADVESALGDVR